VWEYARLQQLFAFARLGDDPQWSERACDLIERQLLGFVRGNPPWNGVHYVSAMECALRIIAVIWAYDIARPVLSGRHAVGEAVQELVAGHADLIRRRLSLHSSAGNHTIAEAAGLVHAGALFPEFPRASDWLETGIQLLESEYPRQVLPDGGGVEQAPWYLLFITDLVGLCALLLEGKEKEPTALLEDRLNAARGFLSALSSDPRGLPRLGDCDDGYALSPDLRLSYAHVEPEPSCRVFPATGCSVSRVGRRGHVKLVFDHGPLGMPPSFGHGHADALSVLLWHGDRPILIDPGTYTYRADGGWREYFRSTAGHNTIMLDGQDQSTQRGAFLWTEAYRARLIKHDWTDGVFRALATHDGYAGGVLRATHYRALTLDAKSGLLVWDRLEGCGVHEVALHWHLSSMPLAVDTDFLIDEEWRMTIPTQLKAQLYAACDAPRLGWRSSVYGSVEPAATVRCLARLDLPCDLLTLLHMRPGGWSPERVEWEQSLFRSWLTES
jgi:hypothetical protein